jgi:hypothetical protein
MIFRNHLKNFQKGVEIGCKKNGKAVNARREEIGS